MENGFPYTDVLISCLYLLLVSTYFLRNVFYSAYKPPGYNPTRNLFRSCISPGLISGQFTSHCIMIWNCLLKSFYTLCLHVCTPWLCSKHANCVWYICFFNEIIQCDVRSRIIYQTNLNISRIKPDIEELYNCQS